MSLEDSKQAVTRLLKHQTLWGRVTTGSDDAAKSDRHGGAEPEGRRGRKRTGSGAPGADDSGSQEAAIADSCL